MAPHPAYKKEEVEAYKLEIQEILVVLTTAVSTAESRTPLTLPLATLYEILITRQFTHLS